MPQSNLRPIRPIARPEQSSRDRACARLSDALAASGGGTPPQVFFEMWDETTLLAAPEGALLQCDWLEPRRSRVTVTEADGTHVAMVVTETPADGDDTEEAVAIASALYWKVSP